MSTKNTKKGYGTMAIRGCDTLDIQLKLSLRNILLEPKVSRVEIELNEYHNQ